MNQQELANIYRNYVDCLNQRDWAELGRFVQSDASHNGRPFGLDGYRAMLEDDVARIPDLHFDIQVLVANPPWIAARLWFDVTPKGVLFGIPVNGRKISFAENVFYHFTGGKIREVWSVIDKQAIEDQLQ